MSDQDGPRALRLEPKDNVAVVLADTDPGATVEVDGFGPILAEEAISRGHKIALEEIPEGAHVFKYGEVIGVSTASIRAGGHVHTHNLDSARLPGPGDAETGTSAAGTASNG